MARRPRKTCRWSIALAEALLLQGLLASAGHASDAVIADAANPALLDPGGDQVVAGGADLYLDTVINGAPNGLVHFGYRNGELWSSVATLRQLGFVLPADTPDPVRLNSLQGVQADYDQARQAVVLTVPLKLLNLSATVLNSPQNDVPHPNTSPGLLLNYDVYGTAGQHDVDSLSAYTELRAFSNLGLLSNTALMQAYRSGAGDANDAWHGRSARLDTTWSLSFPDTMTTLSVGDTLSSYLPWSRATRMAGVQYGTNFSLQPYRITTPLPALLGSAALPSDVELYVNGLRQYSGKVPAGPFQLNTIPNITGAGNAQVVLTDALGRATTLDFSIYNAHQLLQEGLSNWSMEVGVVRKNYGIDSFDYGHDPAASASWSRGITNNFTLETHAELTNGLSNEGIGGGWLFGQAGVLTGSVAHSENAGQSGMQYNLGYDWRNERFNFSVNGTRTEGQYRDVATLYGAPIPLISARATAGYTSNAFGSFGISYLHLRYQQQAASRYGSVYWFRSFSQRISLSLNVNQNLDLSRDRSIFLGATIVLDRNISVSASAQRNQGHDTFGVDASQPLPSDNGFGWRTGLRQGEGQNGGYAELDYLARYGQFTGGVYAVGDTRYAYGDATGSIVLMGGHPFISRRIDNGFAVVSTDGIPNVPVNLENRPIGTTDTNGMLLVTPLGSYQNNNLSIDPMKLPADMRIDHVKTIATPSDRAGALVSFGIEPVRAASISLVDATGKALPVGSEVRANGATDTPAVVGFDGMAYLDSLKAHNTLEVTMPNGKCHAAFDYAKQADGSIPFIGPLTCVANGAR